jgi:predicted AAA+ superfamily ATPase
MAKRVKPPASAPRAAQQSPRSAPSQETLERIAGALERLAPRAPAPPRYDCADAFSWHPDQRQLVPVVKVNRVEMSLLKGIDRVRDMLLENTDRFARGLPANNALLWGARGMGKSSLVKAVHAEVNAARQAPALSAPHRKSGLPDLRTILRNPGRPGLRRGRVKGGGNGVLKLVEIHREDIESLPELMALMRGAAYRFIVFCDDLSFEAQDTSYKSLKAMLEGGIEGRPDNVVFYATSNRRHLMARDMMENERASAINPGEAVEEKVSLSDRFGLWLGFHRCSQDEFLAMVDGYVSHYGISHPREQVHREALEWATTRGARSGRVAWQYVQDLAGRLGVAISDDAGRTAADR